VTPAELLKACRLAEMHVTNDGLVFASAKTWLSAHETRERAWIESRCASGLVGMVRERGRLDHLDNALCKLFSVKPNVFGICHSWSMATDEHRIRASWVALKGEEL